MVTETQGTNADERRLSLALDGLGQSGILTEQQRHAVVAAYRATSPSLLDSTAPEPRSRSEGRLRAELVEAASYLGGVLVGASLVALLAQRWNDLTTTGQVLTLMGLAVLAWLVNALTVFTTPDRRSGIRRPANAPRRRVASVLMTVGSVLAGAAVASAFPDGEWTGVLSTATVLVLLVLAQFLAPSALTEVGMFAATLAVVGVSVQLIWGTDTIDTGDSVAQPAATAVEYALPLAIAACGLLWAGVVAPRLRLPMIGLVIGLATALWISVPFAGTETTRTAGLTQLAVLAALGLVVYLRLKLWPWLALAALSLAVFVILLVGESAGSAAGLLAAGVLLLAATAWGARRMRKPVEPDAEPESSASDPETRETSPPPG